MRSFHESMIEYRKQLEKGIIKDAYRGLMEYFSILRAYLKKKYPNYFVSSSIYHGYMDMTYFAFFPRSLKLRKLKVGIVFLHESFRFEVWLFGYNKAVQVKYWNLFKKNNWNKYSIPSTTKGVDSILEYVLVDNPDFSDLDALTKKVERETLNFIEDIGFFLSKC